MVSVTHLAPSGQLKANAGLLGLVGVAKSVSALQVYVGGVTAYVKKCDEVAANGYEGFKLSG